MASGGTTKLDLSSSSSPSDACIIPPPPRRPSFTSLTSNTQRLVFVGVVVLLVLAVLCSVVATRHSAPTVVYVDPSQQLPAPPLASSRNDLDALRRRVQQLQLQLDEIRKNQHGMPEAVWPFYYYYRGGDDMAEMKQVVRRNMAWQPMRRRRIAWQPMKRSDDEERPNNGVESPFASDRMEQLIRAVEKQLMGVLEAGEQLGVSAEQILAHLRMRNSAAAPIAR